MSDQMIQLCTDIIQNSHQLVVLTGAGISTESGIKDFRSRTGIYKMIPEKILSLDYFYEHPEEFYEFAFSNLYHPKASPNMGHRILAKWEREGKVKKIITQNIDELHDKAGSHSVIEFHGTMKTATCVNCGHKYSMEELVQMREKSIDFYICHRCSSYRERDRYLKPDVVLFGDTGQWFTYEGFSSITEVIKQSDCILVLGTSLMVTPFAQFPQYRRKNVPLIIINKGTTPYDSDRNTYVLQESIGETLLLIDENMNKKTKVPLPEGF